MGSSSSKPNGRAQQEQDRSSSSSSNNNKANSDVLLPPLFAIPTGNGGSNNNPLHVPLRLPPSVQDRLVIHQTTSPSLIEHLHQTDPSVRLLNDFLQPGFWIASNAAAGTHVQASCMLSPSYFGQQQQQQQQASQISSSSSSSSTYPLQTHICIERSRLETNNNNNNLKLTAGTDPQDLPALQASMNLFSSPTLTLLARSNVQGQGWMGLHWAKTLLFSSSKGGYNDSSSFSSSSSSSSSSRQKYYRNDPFEKEYETTTKQQKQQEMNLHLGAWITLDANEKKKKLKTASSSAAAPDSIQTKLLLSSIQSVNVSAATNLLGATAALEASLPINRDNQFDYGAFSTRSYLSINLTDQDNDENNDYYPNPPLRLSLERTNGINNNASSLNLSQTIYLDRYQLNPFEDRAPMVRNALAWALSLERSNNLNNKNNGNTQESQNPMQVSLAGAWQINRAVAVKTKVEPNAITTALILKRWKQPRVLCSIQYCHDWTQQRQQQQVGSVGTQAPRQSWGIGFEVETGRWNRDSSFGGGNTMASLYPVGDNASSLGGVSKSGDDDIPPTIPSSWTESRR